MSSLGKKLIEGLERLVEDLKTGQPMETIIMERIETPDGPMHVRRKIVRGEKNVLEMNESD